VAWCLGMRSQPGEIEIAKRRKRKATPERYGSATVRTANVEPNFGDEPLATSKIAAFDSLTLEVSIKVCDLGTIVPIVRGDPQLARDYGMDVLEILAAKLDELAMAADDDKGHIDERVRHERSN
jgi:hypothetical protein